MYMDYNKGVGFYSLFLGREKMIKKTLEIYSG